MNNLLSSVYLNENDSIGNFFAENGKLLAVEVTYCAEYEGRISEWLDTWLTQNYQILRTNYVFSNQHMSITHVPTKYIRKKILQDLIAQKPDTSGWLPTEAHGLIDTDNRFNVSSIAWYTVKEIKK